MKLLGTAKGDREGRVLHRLFAVSRAVKTRGWDDNQWAAEAHLGPADRLWVEAVGLGLKHVAATAGTLRVAGRVMGEPMANGVFGRMLLGQVVGHSDEAPAVTAALAGLGLLICQPVAICAACPLSEVCLSANSPAVAK